MRRGPHVSGWACPVSTLTGWTQSTGPTGPLAVALGGGPRPATSAAGAGATPATKTAAAPRRSWPESRYGARGGAGLGPFERARSAASRGGRGFAGLGRNRRRRAAEAAARTGARRKRGYGGLSSKRRGWGASTRGGECNGLEPVTKRSPEPCRRRAPRRCVQTLIGDGARRHRRECARACSAPRNPRSTTVSSDERDGGWVHGGEVHRGDQSLGTATG